MRTVDIDRVLSKKLRNHPYDFILIDPPPSFGKINGIALMASSGILIPTQLSPYPIRAIEYVIAQAREVEAFKDEPLPILGIAVSMYDQKSSSFNKSMKEKIDEILEITGESSNISVLPEETWIPRLNFVSNLPDKSYPIYQAEFDDQLSHQDKTAASKASERYTEVANFFIKESSNSRPFS